MPQTRLLTSWKSSFLLCTQSLILPFTWSFPLAIQFATAWVVTSDYKLLFFISAAKGK